MEDTPQEDVVVSRASIKPEFRPVVDQWLTIATEKQKTQFADMFSQDEGNTSGGKVFHKVTSRKKELSMENMEENFQKRWMRSSVYNAHYGRPVSQGSALGHSAPIRQVEPYLKELLEPNAVAPVKDWLANRGHDEVEKFMNVCRSLSVTRSDKVEAYHSAYTRHYPNHELKDRPKTTPNISVHKATGTYNMVGGQKALENIGKPSKKHQRTRQSSPTPPPPTETLQSGHARAPRRIDNGEILAWIAPVGPKESRYMADFHKKPSMKTKPLKSNTLLTASTGRCIPDHLVDPSNRNPPAVLPFMTESNRLSETYVATHPVPTKHLYPQQRPMIGAKTVYMMDFPPNPQRARQKPINAADFVSNVRLEMTEQTNYKSAYENFHNRAAKQALRQGRYKHKF